MVAGEMDPKYAVDLFREQISKPGQQTSGKYWGTGGDPWSKPRVKMKGCGGDERGRREREGSENTEEERESEPVCLCVRLCTSVCWRKDFKEPAEQRLLRFFTSSFFFPQPKLLSRWIPLLSFLIIHLSLLKGSSQAYWIL